MAERLAGAPWRRANREAVAGRGADADGWGLPGRDATIDAEGVAVKEGQWRSGSGCGGRSFDFN